MRVSLSILEKLTLELSRVSEPFLPRAIAQSLSGWRFEFERLHRRIIILKRLAHSRCPACWSIGQEGRFLGRLHSISITVLTKPTAFLDGALHHFRGFADKLRHEPIVVTWWIVGGWRCCIALREPIRRHVGVIRIFKISRSVVSCFVGLEDVGASDIALRGGIGHERTHSSRRGCVQSRVVRVRGVFLGVVERTSCVLDGRTVSLKLRIHQ